MLPQKSSQVDQERNIDVWLAIKSRARSKPQFLNLLNECGGLD